MAQFLDLNGLKTYNNEVVAKKYYAKTSGEADRTDIDAILKGDKALVTPVISTNTWGVTNKSGQAISGTYSGTAITVPTGATVTYTGKWKWTHNDNYKDPESVAGVWGTAKPATGVESAVCDTQTKTSKNAGNVTVASVTLSAAKKGLMLNGQKVVQASGSDSTGASTVIYFRDNVYYGPVTAAAPDAATIAALATYLTNTKSAKVTATTTASQYFCYAYPKSYGEISTIVADGADPIKDNFRAVQTVSVTNTAGLAKDYYVYVSTNMGAFSNNSLAFN